MKPRFISEVDYGVYVWLDGKGRILADEDGNYLSIAAFRNSQKRIDELRAAARACGIEDGEPLFLEGHRKITDEEYEEQVARMEMGLIPDVNDIAAAVEGGRDRAHGR